MTTTLPCGDDNVNEDFSECSFCNYTSFDFDASCEGTSFENLTKCLTENYQDFTWEECSTYEFDRQLRPDVLNWYGEKWETAVTEFELFCGQEMTLFIYRTNSVNTNMEIKNLKKSAHIM